MGISVTTPTTQDGMTIGVMDALKADVLYLQETLSREVFADLPKDSELACAVSELQTQLDGNDLRLAILAEANAGKSTFINALLERELLPSGITVGLTAVPTYIHYADNTRAAVTGHEGIEQTLDVSDLAQLVREGEQSAGLARADVWCPTDFLRQGITIVDTPGSNVAIEHHTEATKRVIEQCNACVFLIDSSRPGTKSTLTFLREVAGYVDKFFFVLSRADIWEEAEVDEAVEYLRDVLARDCDIDLPRIYPVSARQALEGSKSTYATNFARLRNDMLTVLERDRELILAAQVMDVEERVIELAREQAEDRISAYECELARLAQTSFPSLEEFSDRLIPETQRQLSERFGVLRADLTSQAERLRPTIVAIVMTERSRRKLRNQVPESINGVVHSRQQAFYGTLQREATAIYGDITKRIDDQYRVLLAPVRALGARLLLKSALPYSCALLASLVFGLARWHAGWVSMDLLWVGLVSVVAFVAGLGIEVTRTASNYRAPSLTQAQGGWRGDTIASRVPGPALIPQSVARNAGRFGIQTARTALQQGPQAGLTMLGVGLAIGVVAAGVAAIWDHFTGPTVEQLQTDLLEQIEPGLVRIEQAMHRAATDGLDEYEAACAELVTEKLRANEDKYERFVKALVVRSRSAVERVEANAQCLRDILAGLIVRQDNVASLRAYLKTELAAR